MCLPQGQGEGRLAILIRIVIENVQFLTFSRNDSNKNFKKAAL